jgi:hypothetical protein
MAWFARMLGATIVLTAALPALAQPQPEAPKLSRQQRAALEAVVRAVDAGAAIEDVDEGDWPVHLLRTSDGAHYVAFSVASPHLPPGRPLVLYVRLATRYDIRASALQERSLVAAWLAGQAPGPPLNPKGIAFGDMPTFGAGAIATRGPGPQPLQLLELERERARQRREAEERLRKESLEGGASDRGPRPALPFEDFDLSALVPQTAPGMLRRSLTAGPGDYDLLVGWGDPDARDVASSVHVVRRRLSLPAASSTAFGLSSVVLADDMRVRETPLAAAKQASQPYSIGTLDITPAVDRLFNNDERVAILVQVLNARVAPTGKPDVNVTFRMFRRSATGEEAIGTLAPQIYNEVTLPPGFDLMKGHPLFAAVAVPLRTFKRGEYRLEVTATDRIAAIGTTADATFTVRGTAAALLREAPPLAAPFRRADLLQPSVLDALVTALRPSQPSAALDAALNAARAGAFTDLLRDSTITPEEAAERSVLRTLALYALGDGPASLATSLQQALPRGASPAAVRLLLGALRALEGHDADAVSEWESAIEAGAAARPLVSLVADALLRQGDAARAIEVAERDAQPSDVELLRRIAAARIAQGRDADALRLLNPILMRRPADIDAQWLTIHALFAGYVAGNGVAMDAGARMRLLTLVSQYAAAGGPHAALGHEWAAAVK